MSNKSYLYEEILSYIIKFYRLHWDKERSFPCLMYMNNDFVDGYDDFYITIPPTEIELKESDGQPYICDGVLMWGDCCLEFHELTECDALNWSLFTEESVLKIAELVKKQTEN